MKWDSIMSVKMKASIHSLSSLVGDQQTIVVAAISLSIERLIAENC